MSQRYGIKQSLHKLAIKYAAPKSADTTPDHICATCEREGKIVEAGSFCKECSEKLCIACLAQHRKFQILKNHQVVKVVEEFGEPKPKIVTKLTDICVIHPTKILNQYCAKDDEICCESCIVTHHSKCGEPEFITKAATGILKSSLPRETRDGIYRIKKELFMLKLQRQGDKNRIVKEKDKILDSVISLRKRMDDILNRLELSAKSKLATKYQSDMKRIKHDVKSCDDSLAELDDVLKKMRTDQETQMFLRIKFDARRSQEKGENIINEMRNNVGTEKINFTVDEALEQWLDNLAALGKYDDDHPMFSGSLMGEFNASFKKDNDHEYIFNSIVNLPNGRTVISDWKNKKLKIFDTSYKQLDYLDLPAEPYSVAYISADGILVTLRDNKTVQFISVDENSKMTLTNKFNMEEYPRGIAYFQDEIYITCGGGIGEINGQLRIYSMDGSLKRLYQDDSHGQRIFLSPKDIVINADKSRIHVVDRKRGFITMTMDGRVVSVFNDPHLVDPCGMTVDNRGNVFVVGSGSNTVVQLTEDGIKVAEVLHEVDGIDHVTALCCHVSVNPRLIVTMEHQKEFKVFTLDEK